MVHVCVYNDDILLTGPTEKEHLETLEEVLQRLETVGVRLKQSKYAFMRSEVEFLGHKVTKHGVQPTEEKVVNNAPTPTNVTFLFGKLLFSFLPNLSSTLAPLEQGVFPGRLLVHHPLESMLFLC